MIEKTYNKTKNVLKKLLKIIKKPEMIILVLENNRFKKQ